MSRRKGPQVGEFYIVKDFWTGAGKDIEESIKLAGKELDAETEIVFVVEVKATVRRSDEHVVER